MGVARRPALVAVAVAVVVVVAGLVLAGCGSGRPHRSTLKPCRLDIGGTLAAELPDGSLVVGAAARHGDMLVVRLRRVTQECQVVRSFGADGTVTVGVAVSGFAEIDALRATPDGRLVLAGGDGHAELVGRLFENGRLDRSFGDRGWTRVRPHERRQRGMPPPAPTATDIAFSRSGSIFLGADDESAHCCVQDFVTELSTAGAPMRAFGNEGSIVLPRTFVGSYTTDVDANDDGSLYVLGGYQGSGCASPSLARVRRDGSLDTAFDAEAARTLKGVEGKRLRFTPTLTSPTTLGALVLVGGLDETCIPPFPPTRAASGGVVVDVRPSGSLERETRFRVPDYAFANAAAIRLPSGRVVAAALVYRANGKARSALVRVFRPDGRSAGVRTVPLSGLPRTTYPSVALVPAAGGDAWLVVGLAKTTRLIPLRVGG